jgi:hypothetical protein
MLMKIVAALAICAAFPLGATAEPAMLRERYGSAVLKRLRAEDRRAVIEKVNVPRVKAPRKHYFAHNWLKDLKWTATFEWSALT